MDFFTQLNKICPLPDLSIRIKEKNGKLTVSVLPEGGSAKRLTMTGKPDDLDQDFFAVLGAAPDEIKGLTTNLEDLKKEASSFRKPQEALKTSKKESGKSKAVGKKTPGGKKKRAGPLVSEQSIFDTAEKTDKQVDEELSSEGTPGSSEGEEEKESEE